MANMANTAAYTLPDGRLAVDVTANKTLALVDAGYVQNVITDAITITLPATTAAASFTVRNGGALVNTSGPAGARSGKSVLVTIAPNASDQIAGNNFTATDNKAALNTKATSGIGDELRLTGDGTNGWIISQIKGIWARAT